MRDDKQFKAFLEAAAEEAKILEQNSKPLTQQDIAKMKRDVKPSSKARLRTTRSTAK